MTDLVDAYQRREVHLAEKILKGKSLYLSISQSILKVDNLKITVQQSWTTVLSVHISANYFVVCERNISSISSNPTPA